MAKISLTSIGVGAADNDGTGDPLRTGGQTINSNSTSIAAAINELASQNWEIDNTSETLALGEQVIAQSHAGITKTLPAAAAVAADDFNHIIIANADTNSDITISPQAGEEIFFEGATLGSGTSHTLSPGFMALIVSRASGDWNLFQIAVKSLDVSDLGDVTISAIATGELMKWDGSGWINNTLAEANIVARDAPAIESSLAILHDSRATSTGTETIDVTTDPSVYLQVGGSSVIIDFDVSNATLPFEGLADARFSGKIFVELQGAYTGPTIATTASTPTVLVNNGNAPSGATNDRGILAWEYFNDGTEDWLWTEWLSD